MSHYCAAVTAPLSQVSATMELDLARGEYLY